MHRNQSITVIVCLSILLAACAPEMPMPPTATPVLSAPPVEGEHAAPPVAATPAVKESRQGKIACVLVGPENGSDMECLGMDSQAIATYSVPDSGYRSQQSIHPAGLLPSTANQMPLVVHAWQPEPSPWVVAGLNIQELRKTDGFFALAGAAGQSALVVAEAASSLDGVSSAMFAGGLQDIGTASAFLQKADPVTRMALFPLGVSAVGDVPTGVWYTLSAWGIGASELVFPVTRGLAYYDLTAGKDRQVLGSDRSPQGLSPDLRFAASVSFDPLGDRALVVHDLETSASIRFEPDPASDRGAGLAVFNSDSSKIAWLEAQGVLVAETATFLSRVRIGDTASGNVLHQVEHAGIQQVVPGFTVALVKPAVWLEDQTLLIEVANRDWDQSALVRMDANSGEISFFSSGRFIGLVYQ